MQIKTTTAKKKKLALVAKKYGFFSHIPGFKGLTKPGIVT